MNITTFGPGDDPQAITEAMAKAISDGDSVAATLATDLITIGAAALMLANTPEHVEECPAEHTPWEFLRHFADFLENAEQQALEDNMPGISWEKYREKFWGDWQMEEAENSLRELPETLTVDDILGGSDGS